MYHRKSFFESRPKPYWRRLSRTIMKATATSVQSHNSVNGETHGGIEVTAETVIRVNIGGRSFAFLESRLTALPATSLCKFAQSSHETRLRRCDAYLEDTREYFWSRSPQLFDPIANFYFSKTCPKSRKLHLPRTVCLREQLAELKFWKFPPDRVQNCEHCPPAEWRRSMVKTKSTPERLTFSDGEMSNGRLNSAGSVRRGVTHYFTNSSGHSFAGSNQSFQQNDLTEKSTLVYLSDGTAESFGTTAAFSTRGQKYKTLKARIWNMTENPDTSKWAKIWAFFSMFFVIASVSALIVGSMKRFQDSTGDPLFLLRLAEWVCLAWFIFELVVRFGVTPDKLRFFKSFLNIVDFLSILPFFFELTVAVLGEENSEKVDNLEGAMLILRILKVLRVSRIFKLARYSQGMQTFGAVLKGSLSELGISLIALVTAVIFFSTLMYFVEKDVQESPFDDIPSACWWAIITMTTVGYGDVVPVSSLGKVLASITSISGVLVLAFPVTTIVGNFHKYQQEHEKGVAADKRLRYIDPRI